MDESGGLAVVKRAGKLSRLEEALAGEELSDRLAGIGHTRWATHGGPTDSNAHPHLGSDESVVVVHNGIVENYAELRRELSDSGITFASETDTETIAHLMEREMATGADLFLSLQRVSLLLEGSQAIVAMSPREPGVIVAARLGNAGGVVVGAGDGEYIVASDLAAVLPSTQDVAFLDDGEIARICPGERVQVATADGQERKFTTRRIPIDPMSALKGQYAHFTLKEIMEQPEALADTIQSLVSVEPLELRLEQLDGVRSYFADLSRVVLIGMGTSLHAAMLGRQYIERIAGLPAEVDNASEFRYREPVLDERTLVVSVSQSGESVDVLEGMALAKAAGCPLVTVCNTEGAQTTRVANGTVYTRAGLERGVASTKCFTTATVALYVLALELGRCRGIVSDVALRDHIGALIRVPEQAARTLAAAEGAGDRIAREIALNDDVLFLGRGLAFPVAMEGALKLKEVSYIHAEGYAAGEMKHGPIALISPGFPSVVIATEHALRSKVTSNIEQLQARGGRVFSVITDGDDALQALSDDVFAVPRTTDLLEPVLATIPLQLLAYKVAIVRGCDVDQPRNLAKTVTVE